MGKTRFINPHRNKIRRSFWDVILWQSGYYDDPEKLVPAPAAFSYPMPKTPLEDQEPRALWLNHSSFLIQFNGVNLLTDPIWSDRCSPVPFFGPKRQHQPALKIDQLPDIHYVLISHNHYDHLDKASVKELFARFPGITWLVPSGVKKWFARQGIYQVIERGWWEDAELEGGFKATAVPAQHFSGRHSYDLNSTLWVGWVIEEEKTQKRLYFVGDTGYNPFDFKEIGEKWGGMDLSLIPIGSYVPRKFMSPVHIDPTDAVKIHRDVRSKLSLAMHWKTFCLSDEPMHQPPFDLYHALEKEGIDPLTFLAVEPGREVNW